jgi:flagellar basal-body rod protein FlgB
MFRQALEDRPGYTNKTTRSGHLVWANSDPLAVNAVVVSENHHTMRMDGNNVDIDREMTELAQNTIQYNSLIQKASDEYARLNIAITGSR